MSRSFTLSIGFGLLALGCREAPVAPPDAQTGSPRTVTAAVQMRPGGPVEEVEMAVHEVPVDPPARGADEVSLDEDELVIGVVVEGRPVAYPVRYLARYEVVNDRIGETPLAPTW